MKISLIFVVFLGFSASVLAQDSEPATTIVDATSIKFKLYKVAFSTNADCTSPSVFFESAAGVQADMLTSPTFGKGKMNAGTYRCMMLEVSKLINTTAAGGCTAPRDNLICTDTQQSKLINGDPVTCAGGTGADQKVVLYFTTLSAGNTGTRALLPPTNGTDTTSGLVLSNPIVFPTSKKAILRIVKALINSGTCLVSNPTISISVP